MCARAFGSGPNARPDVTEGELRTALAAAEEEGVIESDERALIEGAMDFREKVVREVMTPRLDIVGISADASLPHALETALGQGHSRMPVYEGSLDKIVGVLAAKDVLPFLKNGDSLKTARDVAREAYFVPENKKLTLMMDELRRGRTLLAIVVDESGGTAGLVTLEDLLEELVGEIQDEYDLEEAPLRIVEGAPSPTLLCDASATVRDFGRFFGRQVQDGAQFARRRRRARRIGRNPGGTRAGTVRRCAQTRRCRRGGRRRGGNARCAREFRFANGSDPDGRPAYRGGLRAAGRGERQPLAEVRSSVARRVWTTPYFARSS